MKNTILTFCALGMTLAAVDAASIGINLGAGRGAASLATGDVAGVVPQSNWNNAAGTTGSIVVLNDDSGSSSGANVSWAVDEEWSVGGSTASTNGTLLNGFFAEQNSGTSTIDIVGIPYATYDLYIYVSHDRAWEDVGLSEANNAFSPFTAVENNTDLNAPITFVQQTTSATGPDNQGDYVLFSGLTASTLNLLLSPVDIGGGPTGGVGAPGGTIDRNAISAIQIVQVPEPSAPLLILGAAVAGILRRRR